MSPRHYEMGRRREAAAATRLKIIEAARLLIGGRGDLETFSMEAVAKKAGVARMTVYYQFHSRVALVDALSDYLAQRGGMHRMREVFMEPDPEKALRHLVEVFVDFWASDRITLRRLRAMEVMAPSQLKGPRSRDSWRREAVRNLMGKFRPAGPPTGVGADWHIDVVTTLTSFETFDSLCTNGRSPKEVADELASLALILIGGKKGTRLSRIRSKTSRGS